MRTRHPDFNIDLVKHQHKAMIIEASVHIPQDQRQWSCPICNAGLPALPNQDRLRAIRHHCSLHPGETAHSLYVKTMTGKPKPATAKALVDQHAAVRKKKWPAHDVVQVKVAPEERKHVADRGSKYYCRKCLGEMGKKQYRINTYTCAKTRKAIKTDSNVQQGKRLWWRRLQAERPQLCSAFLAATGWTKAEVDTYFNVAAYENSTRRLS